MESEYVILSTAFHILLPLKQLLKEVPTALGVTKDTEYIHTTIWEDIELFLKLANIELPRIILHSKHFALYYHWCYNLILK
eukprot:13088762-Ditylum_brightwellii.AAC.1